MLSKYLCVRVLVCMCVSTIRPGSTPRHLLVIIDELWERHPLYLMKTHRQCVAGGLAGTYVHMGRLTLSNPRQSLSHMFLLSVRTLSSISYQGNPRFVLSPFKELIKQCVCVIILAFCAAVTPSTRQHVHPRQVCIPHFSLRQRSSN